MDDVLEKINNLYGIQLSFYEKVDKGFLSDNYIVSNDTEKYFLKKYRFKDPKRIENVHSSKKYFSAGGIPVILPIKLLNGDTFFENAGAYYALFPFINGKHLERGTLTNSAIISMGETLGKIHLLGKKSTLEINDYFKIEDREKVFKKIDDILNKIKEKESLDEFDKTALENIELKKKLILENPDTFESLGLKCDHLIHGDYLEHNIFFDEKDCVEYVFDFEKTGYAPRTFELFRSMVYSLLTENASQKTLDDSRIYIEAYNNVYQISKDDIDKGLRLFFLKTIHSFWVEDEHYLKNNNRVDHFLFTDANKIKYLSENLQKISDSISVNIA